MGGKKSVPQKDPREEIEDAIFNMKFTAKQFENAAKKAQKEQKKEIQKAKDVRPSWTTSMLPLNES